MSPPTSIRSRVVPGLSAYLDPMPKPFADGGFYTKTRDNRPLIGPLSVPGTFVCGAFSGYGIMGSQAAAELLGAHITGNDLPDYAPAFSLERFQDLALQAEAERWDVSGQL